MVMNMIELLFIGSALAIFLAYLMHLSRMRTKSLTIKHPIGNRVAFLRYFEDSTEAFWYHDAIQNHKDSRGIRTLKVRMRDEDVAVFITANIHDPAKKVEYTFLTGTKKFRIPRGQSLKDHLKANGYQTRGFIYPKFFRDHFLR